MDTSLQGLWHIKAQDRLRQAGVSAQALRAVPAYRQDKAKADPAAEGHRQDPHERALRRSSSDDRGHCLQPRRGGGADGTGTGGRWRHCQHRDGDWAGKAVQHLQQAWTCCEGLHGLHEAHGDMWPLVHALHRQVPNRVQVWGQLQACTQATRGGARRRRKSGEGGSYEWGRTGGQGQS